MGNDFFDLLVERIIDKKFTAQRLKDAVNYVIDNFQYKELNISDVIKFDRKIKLYTYNEMCDYVYYNGGTTSEYFESKKINGIRFWIKKSDLALTI